MKKILLIGPLPPPLGGATVLFRQLVDYFTHAEGRDFAVRILRTNPEKGGFAARVFRALGLVLKLIAESRRADIISLHASTNSALSLALIVCVTSRFCGKKWMFRGFGGSYIEWFESASVIRRWAIKWCFSQCALMLLETKQSVSYFKTHGFAEKVCWFPNSRPVDRNVRSEDPVNTRKFVYIGQVCFDKGIKELIQAAEQLPDDLTIDVYGPLLDGLKPADIDKHGVKYKGVIQPSDVREVLSRYCALVFPTHYKGEGYPGVILESYSVGMPVITTNFRAIPEIVDDSSGILIETGSVDELATAITRLAENPLARFSMRNGALEKANIFEADRWNAEFVSLCQTLM